MTHIPISLRILTAPLIFFTLLGCVEKTPGEKYAARQALSIPYKSGAKDPAEILNAITECRAYAARSVPANNVTTTEEGWTSPTQVFCTGSLCTATGGQTIGGGTSTKDMNKSLRGDVVRNCIAQQGIQQRSIPPCPYEEMGSLLERASAKGKDNHLFMPQWSNRVCYAGAEDTYVFFERG